MFIVNILPEIQGRPYTLRLQLILLTKPMRYSVIRGQATSLVQLLLPRSVFFTHTGFVSISKAPSSLLPPGPLHKLILYQECLLPSLSA